MHLLIYFCGTGNSGKDFDDFSNYLLKNKNVYTIKVKGCEQNEVCGNGIAPDLKGFAQRFTHTLLQHNSDNKTLSFATTKSEDLSSIGIAIVDINLNLDLMMSNKHPYKISKNKKSPEEKTKLINESLNKRKKPNIKTITLCGYSRGAVTCFEVAKVLYEMAPHIPVNIVADQPVPGNAYSGLGSNIYSVFDCSHLNNLKNVSIILGAYTGERQQKVDLVIKSSLPEKDGLTSYTKNYIFALDEQQYYYVDSSSHAAPCKTPLGLCNYNPNKYIKNRKLDTDKTYSIIAREIADLTAECNEEACYKVSNFADKIFHRAFYSQVVPKLHVSTKIDITVLPREHHNDQQINDPFGDEHMHLKILELFAKQKIVRSSYLDMQKKSVKETYKCYPNFEAKFYPPIDDVQSIWGIENNELYNYIDPYHPRPLLRNDSFWKQEKQSLRDWINEQEKKISFFANPFPEGLSTLIDEADSAVTQEYKYEKLKNIFVEAHYWLLVSKDDISRIRQIENLHNNVFDHLLNVYQLQETELHIINREILHKNKYFLNHWKQGRSINMPYSLSFFSSMSASYEEECSNILPLDKAFAEHANADMNDLEQADKKLFITLDDWIQNIDVNNKFYRLVNEIKNHLNKIIFNCYLDDQQDIIPARTKTIKI